MEKLSLWQTSTPSIPEFAPLNHNLSCDAVVIGAGLTGVLTAWMLQEKGLDVILLERDTPGQGATGRTTGKITAQHGMFYAELISSRGLYAAKQYLQANQSAIHAYADLVEKLNIDCDFQYMPSYLYSRTSETALESELTAARSLGLHAELVHETELPFPVAAAIKFSDQACFHPLKFLRAFLPKLRIYTQTTARSIRDGHVLTDRGIVRAKHIIAATRFPFFLKPGFYFARMHQERSYALSFSASHFLDGMYIDAEKNGINFRPWQNQIILSGVGHRTGHQPMIDGYEALHLAAQRWYPGCEITAQWSTEDCMPFDRVPYIGSYHQKNHHLHVATGFQKWGMSSAMIAAQTISDSVFGQKNEYADVFSPQRSLALSKIGRALSDGGQSISNLLSQVFYIPSTKLQEIEVGHGGIVQWNGKKFGVYHSEDDHYYLVSTRCPHMGCQLFWNKDELSWDCPCHGSRFSYKGVPLDAPGAKNLPFKRIKESKNRKS